MKQEKCRLSDMLQIVHHNQELLLNYELLFTYRYLLFAYFSLLRTISRDIVLTVQVRDFLWLRFLRRCEERRALTLILLEESAIRSVDATATASSSFPSDLPHRRRRRRRLRHRHHRHLRRRRRAVDFGYD